MNEHIWVYYYYNATLLNNRKELLVTSINNYQLHKHYAERSWTPKRTYSHDSMHEKFYESLKYSIVTEIHEYLLGIGSGGGAKNDCKAAQGTYRKDGNSTPKSK